MATTDPVTTLIAAVLGIAAALVASGCQPSAPGTVTAQTRASDPEPYVEPKNYSLAIYGYNYSDTEIGSFSVGHGGGGNLEVSIPEAGGGKTTCCVKVYGALYKTTPITVKWTRDGDVWCVADVMIDPHMPDKPEYLEVHFYPDGHIEAAATEMFSAPRLKLDRRDPNSRHQDDRQNVNNDSKFGSCKHGYN